MQGFYHVVSSITLPNNEGSLKVGIHSDSPSKTIDSARVDSLDLFNTKLSHCSCPVTFASVSDNKRVMYCPGCGLRLEIPKDTKTVGDLRNFFEAKAVVV